MIGTAKTDTRFLVISKLTCGLIIISVLKFRLQGTDKLLLGNDFLNIFVIDRLHSSADP